MKIICRLIIREKNCIHIYLLNNIFKALKGPKKMSLIRHEQSKKIIDLSQPNESKKPLKLLLFTASFELPGLCVCSLHAATKSKLRSLTQDHIPTSRFCL